MGLAEHGETADAALLALAAKSSAPVSLHLLIADRCNHACQHCYQVQGLKGELSRDQLEAILREFRESGGFVVTFSGGEATLREDLIPLLGYAHELGLATVLYTNGFTVTEAMASAIAACHVWRVEISLYSDIAEEHDAVTRVPGSWLKTTQGIRALRTRRVNVTVKFTPATQSSANIERMVQLALELDAHLFAGELVNAGEAARVEPAAARRVPEDAVWGSVGADAGASNPLHGKPCGAGDQRHLSVRSDGRVQPCSQLQTPMGQAGQHAHGLAEAAQSDVAQFFRDVTWADFHGCRDCEVRAHCRRCFASAAVEVGDMLAPYRGACELAAARYIRATNGASIVAPTAECASDRNRAVGPYRILANGDLQPVPDRYTERDRLLVAHYPWLRPSREDMESSACGLGSARRERGLIQLRRLAAKSLDGVPSPT